MKAAGNIPAASYKREASSALSTLAAGFACTFRVVGKIAASLASARIIVRLLAVFIVLCGLLTARLATTRLLSTLAPSFGCALRVILEITTGLTTAFASDLTLLVFIHRRKAAIGRITLLIAFIWHFVSPMVRFRPRTWLTWIGKNRFPAIPHVSESGR
jgi:hypothetical protein